VRISGTPRRHPDLVFGDPQGEEVAAVGYPFGIGFRWYSCFHDRSSYRELSPHLQRAPHYKGAIFDMPLTGPVQGGVPQNAALDGYFAALHRPQ